MKKLLIILTFLFPLTSLAVQPLTMKFVPAAEIDQVCGLHVSVCACYFGGTLKTAYLSDKLSCQVNSRGVVAHEWIHYLVDVYHVNMSDKDEEELATRVGQYSSGEKKDISFWKNSTAAVRNNLLKLLIAAGNI